MSILRKLLCAVRGHQYRLVQEFSPATRRIDCPCCGGDWAMNDRLHMTVPWNGEFAEFYAEHGEIIKEPA